MRRSLRAATWLAAVPCGLLTLSAFGGRLWWLLDLTTHFRPYYAVALLTCTGVALGLKRWPLAGGCWALAVINLVFVVPYFFGETGNGADPVTLLNFNINAARGDSATIVQLLQDEDADVVVLLEIQPDRLTDFTELRSKWPYYVEEPRSGNFGIAIYSRFPLENVQVHGRDTPFITANVSAGAPFSLIAAHVVPPVSSRYASVRNDQLQRVGRAAAAAAHPVVLVGDLNITPWSPYFRQLLRDGEMRDARRGFGLKNSWPSPRFVPRIPIDHVLVGSDIRVNSLRVLGNAANSDHLPVVAELGR